MSPQNVTEDGDALGMRSRAVLSASCLSLKTQSASLFSKRSAFDKQEIMRFVTAKSLTCPVEIRVHPPTPEMFYPPRFPLRTARRESIAPLIASEVHCKHMDEIILDIILQTSVEQYISGQLKIIKQT